MVDNFPLFRAFSDILGALCSSHSSYLLLTAPIKFEYEKVPLFNHNSCISVPRSTLGGPRSITTGITSLNLASSPFLITNLKL